MKKTKIITGLALFLCFSMTAQSPVGIWENIDDEDGKPKEVIIPLEEFLLIEELLGLDLDKAAIEDLQQARQDRESGKKDAYVDLESI